mgnify:CR=1 FL=1
MAIFGKRKRGLEFEAREAELLQEIERLKSLACPEQKELDAIKSSIKQAQIDLKTENENYVSLLKQEAELRIQIDEQKRIEQEQSITISNQYHEITRNELEIEFQSYGIYKPTYEFANSDLYKDQLKLVREEQKKIASNGTACVGATDWTINGDRTKGRKMVKDMQKLLLRAFNTECDSIISKVRVSNYDRCVSRMEKARDTISKCASSMSIQIDDLYLNLKKRELALALDYAQEKEKEKERLKELRAQQREEAKAQKEIEEARKKLEKEQMHYQNALSTLSAQIQNDPQNPDLIAKKEELEAQIADTQKAIENVDYREANKRAGYVYVISNIGAFGEDIYKIGMTRRLDPMDRVNELGDASVPFNFDVHALIFTEDAPGLETALHNAFEDRKVNKINPRREFFHVTLDEIKKVVRENFDKTVEWVDVPEAEQYRQSALLV